MSTLQDGFGGYLALFVAGYLATELWRWLGMAVGARLDLAGAPFQWVRAVATALVAGLVARMVIFPAGALASVPMAVRLGAFAGGIALYFGLRRSLAVGVAGGAALLLAAQLVRG
ncbi:MAG TPA: AzlD domain-containing protein [Hyphomicrobiaceae bacterium]|nr:AzlD domain-containing protein [Hyphomicrobiaceae bacterium]